MDRRFTSPKRVTSPTWGPPPPRKQAQWPSVLTPLVVTVEGVWMRAHAFIQKKGRWKEWLKKSLYSLKIFVEVSLFLLLINTFFDVCPKLSSLNDNELIWSDTWIT